MRTDSEPRKVPLLIVFFSPIRVFPTLRVVIHDESRYYTPRGCSPQEEQMQSCTNYGFEIHFF
jgi:hypothetical protein